VFVVPGFGSCLNKTIFLNTPTETRTRNSVLVLIPPLHNFSLVYLVSVTLNMDSDDEPMSAFEALLDPHERQSREDVERAKRVSKILSEPATEISQRMHSIQDQDHDNLLTFGGIVAGMSKQSRTSRRESRGYVSRSAKSLAPNTMNAPLRVIDNLTNSTLRPPTPDNITQPVSSHYVSHTRHSAGLSPAHVQESVLSRRSKRIVSRRHTSQRSRRHSMAQNDPIINQSPDSSLGISTSTPLKNERLTKRQEQIVQDTIRNYIPKSMHGIVLQDIQHQINELDERGYVPNGNPPKPNSDQTLDEQQIYLYQQQVKRDREEYKNKVSYLINFTALGLSWFCQSMDFDWIRMKYLPAMVRTSIQNGEFDGCLMGMSGYLRGTVFENPLFSTMLKFVEKVGQAHQKQSSEENKKLAKRRKEKQQQSLETLANLQSFRQSHIPSHTKESDYTSKTTSNTDYTLVQAHKPPPQVLRSHLLDTTQNTDNAQNKAPTQDGIVTHSQNIQQSHSITNNTSVPDTKVNHTQKRGFPVMNSLKIPTQYSDTLRSVGDTIAATQHTNASQSIIDQENQKFNELTGNI